MGDSVRKAENNMLKKISSNNVVFYRYNEEIISNESTTVPGISDFDMCIDDLELMISDFNNNSPRNLDSITPDLTNFWNNFPDDMNINYDNANNNSNDNYVLDKNSVSTIFIKPEQTSFISPESNLQIYKKEKDISTKVKTAFYSADPNMITFSNNSYTSSSSSSQDYEQREYNDFIFTEILDAFDDDDDYEEKSNSSHDSSSPNLNEYASSDSTETIGNQEKQKVIGAYTIEQRKIKIVKFRAKQIEQKKNRKSDIRYVARKELANRRVRIKGRFIGKAMESMLC